MTARFFCTISRNHTTYISVGGAQRKITFDNSSGNAAGFGELVTSDSTLAEAMKNDPRCGVEWVADSTLPPFGPAAAAEPELTPRVCRSVNEAIEWLVGLGYQKNRVNTSEKAIGAARSAGYALSFEKGQTA